MSIQDAINRLPQFEHQVNKLISEEKSTRGESHLRASFIRRCHDLQKQISEHEKKTETIKTDEANQFRKNRAIEQLRTMKDRLAEFAPEKENTSGSKISNENDEDDVKDGPPQPKARTIVKQQSSMYNDEDDESDVEADNEDDEEVVSVHREAEISEVDEPSEPQDPDNKNLVTGNAFIVLKDLPPSADGDLAIREGEILKILETRSDGWWMAENVNGDRGMVPKTYLKHLQISTQRTKASKRLGVRDSVFQAAALPVVNETEPVAPIDATADNETMDAVSKWIGKKVDCLGDALRVDHHLSYACHLAPRLSHSNIAFHDLFWNYQHDQVRKRAIRISKVLRLVRIEGMPSNCTKALVRIALLDESKKLGRQIVSNVHTIQAKVKGTTWNFANKQEHVDSGIELADALIRSNYALPNVVLVIEASMIIKQNSSNSGFIEKSLGVHKIPLLDQNGQPAVVSRTYVEHLLLESIFPPRERQHEEHTRRIFFKVMDVPKDKIHFVDSMPDVIIFNIAYLPFFYYYRRRAGTILIRDNMNALSSEMVSDPLLAVFPAICEQHDILDAMLDLWSAKRKSMGKKSEVEQTIEFFQIFLHTAFFLFKTFPMPDYDINDEAAMRARASAIDSVVGALKRGELRRLIATTKARPVNIFDYSMDLFGSHSID
ncbi:unnamed protein product [Caenorhabditis bovis]|uniref:SH3 domain-containing protein n=1 Tax=Caenorhabditis bovis TaxID=2654633 RepID=A0A8S1FCC5_9PELO|nr:unnamed protein product [Caenorhabditis bovis]